MKINKKKIHIDTIKLFLIYLYEDLSAGDIFNKKSINKAIKNIKYDISVMESSPLDLNIYGSELLKYTLVVDELQLLLKKKKKKKKYNKIGDKIEEV